MKIILQRERGNDEGTYGVLTVNDTVRFQTLELPWRDNKRMESCIPPGVYDCAIKDSPKFGRVYRVNGVPDRSEILIHSGNFAGDEAKGYQSHVEGCILLGLSRGKLQNSSGQFQKAVTSSKPAIKQFMDMMGEEPFVLEVRDA